MNNNRYFVYVVSCVLFVSTFVFYIGLGGFALIFVIIHSFGTVLCQLWDDIARVECIMATLVRECSLLDGS